MYSKFSRNCWPHTELPQYIIHIKKKKHWKIWRHDLSFNSVQALTGVSGAEWECLLSKAKMIKLAHQMDGWPLCAMLCACPRISPKSFGLAWDNNWGPPHVSMHANRFPGHPVVYVSVQWIMETQKQPSMHSNKSASFIYNYITYIYLFSWTLWYNYGDQIHF